MLRHKLVIVFQHLVGCPKPPFVAHCSGGHGPMLILSPATDSEHWPTQTVRNQVCSGQFFYDLAGLRTYLSSIKIRKADAKKINDIGERFFKLRLNELRAISQEAKSGGSIRTKPKFDDVPAIGAESTTARPVAATPTSEKEIQMTKKKTTSKRATTKKTVAKKTAVTRTTAAKKKAATKAAAAKKANGSGGVGAYARELIKAGKLDTDGIVDAVKQKFPDSAFKKNHVSWYRSHM